jgi:hypothetical protein
LDPIPYRSVTLFGRPSKAYSGIYSPLATWAELIAHPEVEKVVRGDYQYVYMDSNWWATLTPEERHGYDDPCVKVVDEVSFKNIEFRRLYDLKACQ